MNGDSPNREESPPASEGPRLDEWANDRDVHSRLLIPMSSTQIFNIEDFE